MDNELDKLLVEFVNDFDLHNSMKFIKITRERIKNLFKYYNLNQEYIDQINTTKENKS